MTAESAVIVRSHCLADEACLNVDEGLNSLKNASVKVLKVH